MSDFFNIKEALHVVLYKPAWDYYDYAYWRSLGISPGFIERPGRLTADEFEAWETRWLREGYPAPEDAHPDKVEREQFQRIAQEAGALAAAWRKVYG